MKEGMKEGRKEGRKGRRKERREGGREGEEMRGRERKDRNIKEKVKTHINAVPVASGSRSTTNDPHLL